jgi:chromosome segregation ATPase
MMSKLTEKEMALAGRVIALQDTSARPRINGGGMMGETLNFISARVPPTLVQIALVVFLGYHAWDYYSRAQQMVAEVESKQGEAEKFKADADAINNRIGADSAALAGLKADLKRLQAEGETAKAESEAQAKLINGVPLRLATVRAEIETLKFEGQKAQEVADAQNETVSGGITRAVAQRSAEIAALNAENRKLIQTLRGQMKSFEGGPDAMVRRSEEESNCRVFGFCRR